MAAPFQSKAINQLGLVAAMVDELGISEIIDRQIPQDDTQRKVTVGQAVKAMILNGLGFANQALYLTPEFFVHKATERLIGPGILPEHLNDDTLGRALDSLYEADVTVLFARISRQACQRLGLDKHIGHLDTTSFHVDGQYNSDEEPETGVVHLTRGYSRDHRPDLHQVMLELVCEHRAGIPLLMKPLNGNSHDTQSFIELIDQHIHALDVAPRIDWWVADSALYSADNLKQLANSEVPWITRVPERLKDAKELILDAPIGTSLAPGYAGFCVPSDYADIAQRWLVVTSQAALERGYHSVRGRYEKGTEQELKAFCKLCRQAFACAPDARKALEKFEKTLKFLTLEETGVEQREAGFYPSACPASRALDMQLEVFRKGRFILATSELDTEKLSDSELLRVYKSQQQVERGFRFLKNPEFQASQLYLKSPKRIMALLMVMTLCLLVYTALEYRIRQRMQEAKATFLSPDKRPLKRPTARRVLHYFEGLQELTIRNREPVQVMIVNTGEYHWLIINLLGERYRSYYT